MRTAMTLLALSLALTSVAACKKKKTDGGGGTTSGSAMTGSDVGSGGSDTTGSATGSGSDTGSAAGSGSDATGAGSGSAGGEGDDAMSKKAGNCPSTVFGSTTKADLKGKDVVLTISSDDKDAIATIQRRTEELLKEKADGAGSGGGAHDQKGSHGGSRGICPVYWEEGGKASSKNNAKGVVITITPKDKVEDFKKVIDDRITKAAEFVKTNVKAGDAGTGGGVGGGQGDHGGNHSGSGDGKGKDRKDGTSGGAGTGGGGSKGTGGGSGNGSGSAK